MEPGSSLVGLDFDAGVAWPIYDWMGVAKAALESVARIPGRTWAPRASGSTSSRRVRWGRSPPRASPVRAARRPVASAGAPGLGHRRRRPGRPGHLLAAVGVLAGDQRRDRARRRGLSRRRRAGLGRRRRVVAVSRGRPSAQREPVRDEGRAAPGDGDRVAAGARRPPPDGQHELAPVSRHPGDAQGVEHPAAAAQTDDERPDRPAARPQLYGHARAVRPAAEVAQAQLGAGRPLGRGRPDGGRPGDRQRRQRVAGADRAEPSGTGSPASRALRKVTAAASTGPRRCRDPGRCTR